jgi:hypothetical protein
VSEVKLAVVGEDGAAQARPAPRMQCAKCPWKVGVDPHQIPNGYSADKHRALRDTIADPDSGAGLGAPAKLMACHETKPGAELPCVGWLENQLNQGGNLGLRMRVMFGDLDGNVQTVGPQHDHFNDTLPRARRGGRRTR